ncbi:MAG TPA: hypothetical protein EYG73_03705 [Arcobacter sp.]|nr:hypothetical protein [Arcobacter sp.]
MVKKYIQIGIFNILSLSYVTASEFDIELGFRSDYVTKTEEIAQKKVYYTLEYTNILNDFKINIISRGYFDFDKSKYHDLWFDEFTISKDYENFSFLLGKHQVNWGESDYLRVVNVINPINLKDYYLSYIEDYKKANSSLWMFQSEYTGNDWGSSLLIIPDFESTVFPHSQTGFYNESLSSYESIQENNPNKFDIKDISVALKINKEIDNYDFSVYSYYGWNHTSLITSSLKKESFRRKVLGVSLSNTIGEFVIRTDNAIYLDEKFQEINYGTSEKDSIKNLIATDWNDASHSISLQVLSTHILSYSNNIIEDEDTIEGTFYIEKRINNNNIVFSNLLLNNFSTNTGINEFKVKYRYKDNINLYFGYDSFWGNEGILSGYSNQNRVFGYIKYFFDIES